MHRRKSGMQHKKLKAITLVSSLAAVAGLAVFGMNSAFAGTNGQIVSLCQDGPSRFTNVVISGSNQNGEQSQLPLNFPNVRCIFSRTEGADFFWKGQVRIDWSGNGFVPDRTTTCDVPASSPEDIVTCTP
jgi:hypothetical protein